MQTRRPSEHERKDRFSIIGQSLPKIDAWAKVTGETQFADDLVLPRMAYGKLLRSPHPHARSSASTPRAPAALPGVYAVITGHDLPRVKFGILPVSPGRGGALRREGALRRRRGGGGGRGGRGDRRAALPS